MTLDEARERVLDYAYGEMSPDEATRFEALLKQDKALQAELEAVRAVRDAATGFVPLTLPADVRGRLLREAEHFARKRAAGNAGVWSFLERFLLSPAFTGAIVVTVALGVGFHLLIEMETEDRLTRIERAERAAVSLSEPVSGPASSEAAKPESAADMEVRADLSKAEKDEARATEAEKAPATFAQREREMAGGGRAPATRAILGGGGATPPPPARPEATAAAVRDKAAEARAARQAAVDDREQVHDESLADLARARHLKARGALDAALTAYRKALHAGTLTGTDLAETLAEAAEVAIALERPDAARSFLKRLKTLPGGPERAAPLERALKRPDHR